MKATDIFKKQHSQIIDSMNEVKPLLKESKFVNDIVLNSSQVLILIGKIAAHFTIKSTTFYPDILKHNNEKVRITAERLKKEMEETKKMFNDYKMKWKKLDFIRENVFGFIEETRNFHKVLLNYLRKEEYELFSLIDSLE